MITVGAAVVSRAPSKWCLGVSGSKTSNRRLILKYDCWSAVRLGDLGRQATRAATPLLEIVETGVLFLLYYRG